MIKFKLFNFFITNCPNRKDKNMYLLAQKLRNFPSKFLSFLKNKYHSVTFKKNIKRKAQYEIVNYREYIKYLLEDNLEKGNKIILNFIDGYKLICQNKSDLGAVGETCILEDYQRIPKYQVHSGDIVFDIGAHIGSFSIYAASKGAIVYAFEPENRNYELLLRNIRINKLEKDIIPFKLGIYKFSGKIPLFISKLGSGGHSIITKNPFKNRSEIEVVTISDVCKKLSIDKIDLLKIDVEGAEYDIFSNMSSGTFKIIDKIVGEYHLFPEKPNLNFLYIKNLLKPYFIEIKHLHPYYFYAKK